ncbi:hypothetical protein LXL04_007023 [Taraxacum kok-saghyz]
MTELNDDNPRRIADIEGNLFTIDEDATNYETNVVGGIFTEVKQPKVLHFETLRENITHPKLMLGMMDHDSEFEDIHGLLHLVYRALDKYMGDLWRFPVTSSVYDIENFVGIAEKLNESNVEMESDDMDHEDLANETITREFIFRVQHIELDDSNHQLLCHFVRGACTILTPIATIVGGIVAQELFYFYSIETLTTVSLMADDFKAVNSRYGAQIIVFRGQVQEHLQNLQPFLIDCGAFGCEFAKIIALMGVVGGPKWLLTLADGDVVINDNLSKQFIFNDWNIGQSKSEVAAIVTLFINPDLHLHIKHLPFDVVPKYRD